MDSYITKIHANHFQEIACLVQGSAAASVIVAAAPAAHWTQARPLLLRAVAAYQVR
jgi:UDP-N-acetylmuramyl pentapeptide synthase